MARNLEAQYDPHGLESKWYRIWEEGGWFSWKKDLNPGSAGEADHFSIVLPPPNVTGSLHLGHALNHTIQDVLTRWHRMRGDTTLWVPGTDHAGIATQNVVEKLLAAEGSDRFVLGREKFEERVWKWRAESGGMITHQQRQLGESVDWDYARFTLDPGLSRLVRKVFVRLYKEGLIYRSEKIINWCPRNQTALSNIEVVYQNQKGKLWFVRYPLEKGGHLIVATTRPETIPGDEALAVHPDDERYQALIGAYAVIPFTGKKIPVIADSYVDREFGSGVVKITPAHDANDFEVGIRHNLPVTRIMDDRAVLNEKAGPYAGLSREEARESLVADLEEADLIEKTEEITHAVGYNERSGAVVEPIASLQWFVKMEPLARPAIAAVRDGRIRFVPSRWENLYFDWMENIQDWCISRQLWWGHRIPAWECAACGHTTVSESDPASCEKCGSGDIHQVEDVLDTWFSSGLWPFSTLLKEDDITVSDWPDASDELRRFYPTSVLVTGFDIIFFWVARMIMFGLRFMGDVPFRDIYMHGLVRDAHRQKMSKSKGNVVNPLEKMEEYGTDAFRFFLMSILPEGKDIIFDESRLKGYSNFCNKIWNTARFILMNTPDDYVHAGIPEPTGSEEQWIITGYNEACERATEALQNYRFADYTAVLYDFLWKSFCDYYVEFAKVSLKNGDQSVLPVLHEVFRRVLQLLHPVMPFITEEIYSYLKPAGDRSLIIRSVWPQSVPGDFTAGQAVTAKVLTVLNRIRRLRSDVGLAPGEKVAATISTDEESFRQIQGKTSLIEHLARLDSLSFGSGPGIKALMEFGSVTLDVAGKVDMARERERISKELKNIETGINNIERKINAPGFSERAPADLVEAEHDKLAVLAGQAAGLRELLTALQDSAGDERA